MIVNEQLAVLPLYVSLYPDQPWAMLLTSMLSSSRTIIPDRFIAETSLVPSTFVIHPWLSPFHSPVIHYVGQPWYLWCLWRWYVQPPRTPDVTLPCTSMCAFCSNQDSFFTNHAVWVVCQSNVVTTSSLESSLTYVLWWSGPEKSYRAYSYYRSLFFCRPEISQTILRRTTSGDSDQTIRAPAQRSGKERKTKGCENGLCHFPAWSNAVERSPQDLLHSGQWFYGIDDLKDSPGLYSLSRISQFAGPRGCKSNLTGSPWFGSNHLVW